MLISYTDIKDKYNISRSTIDTLVKYKKLCKQKLKGKYYFLKQDLDNIIKEYYEQQNKINDQFVILTIVGPSVKYYLNLGYYPIYNPIKVAVKDLPKQSSQKITVTCDMCGKVNEQWVHSIESVKRRNNGNYLCGSCSSRLPNDYYIEKLFDIGVKIIEADTEFLTIRSKVKYSCIKHSSLIFENEIRNILRNKYNCPMCYTEGFGGENHPNFKEGTTKISSYIRSRLSSWILDSLKNCNFKCDITSSNKNLEVHHFIKSFQSIFYEVMQDNNYIIKMNINDYSVEELYAISSKVLEKHYEIGLGIALTKQTHKQYHHIYGQNINLETYLKFKENYHEND